MTMDFVFNQKKLKGLFEVSFQRFDDERGHLTRTLDAETLRSNGIVVEMAQESISYTRKKGTIRGLHVQNPPHLEAKWVTLIRGKMKWVSVDLRRGSPTFSQWDSILLSEEGPRAFYAEKGFAHGCVSLQDDTYLTLKANTSFRDSQGTGIHYLDSDLKIDWDLNGQTPIVSDAHSRYGSFQDFLKIYDRGIQL